MCRWGNTTPIEVIIPADLSHTGQSRRDIKPIDTCIAEIVNALTKGGVLTICSCCGHDKGDGSIMLADGRELIIRQKKLEKEQFVG